MNISAMHNLISTKYIRCLRHVYMKRGESVKLFAIKTHTVNFIESLGSFRPCIMIEVWYRYPPLTILLPLADFIFPLVC